MKVLQITSVDETVRHLLLPLINRLNASGFQVETACSDTRYSAALRRDGYVIHTMDIPRSLSLLAILKNIRELYRLMKSGQYDIIHVHAPVSALTGRIAAKLYGRATVIYTVHGFYFHDNMPRYKYLLYYFVEKTLAATCTDIMFFQSEEDFKLAREKKFLRRKNLFYIGNGVDVRTRFNPSLVTETQLNDLRKELNLKPDQIIVTFIGRLVYEKGLLDLLRAFTSIENKNTRLLVVGSALSSDRDRIPEEKLAPYREHPAIRFAGFRQDIPVILALTDIFCLPSYREGKPRSILEAMAMNCAVIAGNIRGCREVVVQQRNGFLFNIRDIDDLEEKLQTLINNTDLLKVFKKNSYTIARAIYDEELVLDKQMEIFMNLKNDSTRRPRQKSFSETHHTQ